MLQNNSRIRINIIVMVDEENLFNCFSHLSDSVSTAYLLDGAGAVLSSTRRGDDRRTPVFYESIDTESSYGSAPYTDEEGTRCQVVYYRVRGTDWLLARCTPKHLYMNTMRTFRMTAFITALLSMALAAVLYSLWSRRFTKPVQTLTRALTEVQSGSLEALVNEPIHTTELETMRLQFNEMILSIRRLLEHKEKDEQRKRQLEMWGLQTQINPHFIYNTISSIRWMAQMSGAANVSDMLGAFADLLRPVFSNSAAEWTLDEELTFLEIYIKLVKLCYGGLIRFEILEMEDAADFMLPRFILQPILENACEHGAAGLKPMNIRLEFLYDAELVIRISDDGRGMTEESLAILQKKLDTPFDEENNSASKSGIGLINVYRRLRIAFGERCSMRIFSAQNEGTTVEIRILR